MAGGIYTSRGDGLEPGRAGSSLNRTRTRRSAGEQAIKGLLAAAALLSVLTTTGIVVSLVADSLDFFREVPIADYLFGTEWQPLAGGEQQSFGVLSLLWSTVYLTLVALVVAIPLGLGAAIYLAEYASPRVRRILKPVLEVLAGIPTIVFGYFALTFFTPFLQDIGINLQIFNGLSAGIVLGILVLPTIASVSEDALSAVPGSLREGAFGLGAAKHQVVIRVVFPAALSGIVAGLVLGASRAIGETVLILVAAGNQPTLSLSLNESHQNMAAFIANTARGDIAQGGVAFATIFAVGLTLFIITLGLNLIAIRFVRKYRQVYE
jgi:phosphate transport system permease protein